MYKIEYWNPDGTLEKMEYIPFDEVAQLKDSQKSKIDRNFDGTILILLSTTDTLLSAVSVVEFFYLFEYHIYKICAPLFVIFAAAVYHKRAVNLLAQYHAHELVRKCHFGKRKLQIRSKFHLVRKPA